MQETKATVLRRKRLFPQLAALAFANALVFIACLIVPPSALAANTISVANSAELNRALGEVTGGETIELTTNKEAYQVNVSQGTGPKSKVLIVSKTLSNPAVIHTLFVQNAGNLAFEGVIFDSANYFRTRDSWLNDINIDHGHDISFKNCEMRGTARQLLALGHEKEAAASLALITNSSAIDFIGNRISNYYHGIQLLEVKAIRIEHNTITGIQGDGIRMGGVKDLTISENKLYNFWGTDQNINHSDMIQMWSTNAASRSENVNIMGNLLLSGSGAGSEGIFMRNEQADQAGADAGQYFYKNFSITDNLIQNSSTHGITVGEIDGVLVRNNTLLANPQAKIRWGAKKESQLPRIRIAERSSHVLIAGNVTFAIDAPPSSTQSGNLLVTWGSPTDPRAVQNLFIGAGGGGELPMAAFRVVPDSDADKPWIGARSTQFEKTPSRLTAAFRATEDPAKTALYRFDAALTAHAKGYLSDEQAKFDWDMGDGTKLTGIAVTHQFTKPGLRKISLTVTDGANEKDTYWSYVDVPEPVLLKVEFGGGAASDASTYQSAISGQQKDAIQTVDGLVAYHLSDKQMLSVDRSANQLFGLKRFGLSFYLKQEGNAGAVDFLAGVYQSFGLGLMARGEVGFTLTDVDGKQVSVLTSRTEINDGRWHHVVVNYDSHGGKAEIYIDGALKGRGPAAGPTKPPESWDLTFGNSWGAIFQGYIYGIEFSREPYTPDAIGTLAKLLR